MQTRAPERQSLLCHYNDSVCLLSLSLKVPPQPVITQC